MRTELSFIYDATMRPISALCSLCGQAMQPPSTLRDAADTVMWMSQRFIEHKRLNHSTQPCAEAES